MIVDVVAEVVARLDKIENKIKIVIILKAFDQVNNEGMISTRQNILFVFDMINLFKLNNLPFVQHLDGIALSLIHAKINFTKCSSSDYSD